MYFNVAPYVAMGDDLEPIVLFDSARPGEQVVVAVKLLHTVDTKTFFGATLKIDFPESRPNPEDLREEFLSGALLVPALAPNDASQMSTLTGAIEAVDLKALDASDQNKFDASLRESHGKLEALMPLMNQAHYHLTGNSHIDAAWLWPWTETVDVVKRTFGTALQLMYEYPHYTYTQSAAAYNEWMAQKYPDMNAEIKQRTASRAAGKSSGGVWSRARPQHARWRIPRSADARRQALKFKLGLWRRCASIGWKPRLGFGYTWQLPPQIYKKSGVDYFVTQKMAWNDTNQLPFKYFYWESPDGSKVLAYFPHDYANDNLNPVRLARDFTIAHQSYAARASRRMMDLYGIGDQWRRADAGHSRRGHFTGQPPPPMDTDRVMPKFEFGTARDVLRPGLTKQIAPNSPAVGLQVHRQGLHRPVLLCQAKSPSRHGRAKCISNITAA